MLSPDPESALINSNMDLSLADVKIRVQAPDRILAVLGATLSSVPRFAASAEPDLTFMVSTKDDVWDIRGLDGSHKVLTAQSALPQIGGAIVSSATSGAAASRHFTTMRATVIEKDGRALAMIGDDWESALTLATHLHSRGWSYVGSDNALLDPGTRDVFGIQKALYINASSVSQLPLKYRRSVEASPWYVTAQGISFYAVDPTGAGTGRTWTQSARLCGILVVDGEMMDSPSLESLDSSLLPHDRFARLRLDWRHVSIADLRLGTFVETCDLVEHWFGSLQT